MDIWRSECLSLLKYRQKREKVRSTSFETLEGELCNGSGMERAVVFDMGSVKPAEATDNWVGKACAQLLASGGSGDQEESEGYY